MGEEKGRYTETSKHRRANSRSGGGSRREVIYRSGSHGKDSKEGNKSVDRFRSMRDDHCISMGEVPGAEKVDRQKGKPKGLRELREITWGL